MQETSPWWIRKYNSPNIVAKYINLLINSSIKIYGFFNFKRKTKRNSQ